MFNLCLPVSYVPLLLILSWPPALLNLLFHTFSNVSIPENSPLFMIVGFLGNLCIAFFLGLKKDRQRLQFGLSQKRFFVKFPIYTLTFILFLIGFARYIDPTCV